MNVSRTLLVACALCPMVSAQGADVNSRLEALEQDNRELRQLLVQMQDQKANRSLSSKGWLPSYRGKHFKLGGELELEYVDTQSSAGADNPHGRFKLDKFTLLPSARITDTITLEALTLFKPSSASLSEVYVIFSQLAFDSQLTVGLDDRFINEWPSRRTESFSLIDTAFARDDAIGIVWERLAKFSWHLSLTNGYALAEAGPSEDKSYKFIHDNRQGTDANSNKVLGLGLGWRFALAERGHLALLGFAYQGKFSVADVAFLQGVGGYGTSTDTTNLRYGLALDFKRGAVNLGAKYIRAQDGRLDREGGYLQTGYQFKLPAGYYFKSIEPFVRIGRLDVDLPTVPGDSRTWDRSMVTLALLAEIAKGMKLKTEYYFNGERNGAAEVDNDEFMMQLEVKF